jgi:apolipoprotein N-acyltransferase
MIALYIYPTENIWVLAPLVPALILIATLGMGFRTALITGFLAGQAFYIAHIEWLALYLGPVPLIALSTLMSVYFALGVALTAWLWRKIKPKPKQFLWFAVLASSIWVVREWLAMSFPYGGFPWSRLGIAQAHGPWANWAYFGGISLISFVMALVGAILALAILGYKKRGFPLKSATISLLALILTPALAPLGLLNTPTGSANIAAVQGNANAGLFSNLNAGTILQNHIDATKLVSESELSQDLDLLVWPENSSDVDPLRSDAARSKINAIAAEYDAPFTFGTITVSGDQVYNSTLLWSPDGELLDQYDKKRPVPFAEFVPDRPFWRALAPDLIDLVTRGYSFGTRDGIFNLADFDAGSLICFEIAIDSIPRELALGGANIILSQTNNADFGYSDETYQQAAIAKLRAIETGRAVVNISTVGLSAIYLPDGKTLNELTWYQPGAMVNSVPLYEGITPALILGGWIDAVLALFGFLGLLMIRRS